MSFKKKILNNPFCQSLLSKCAKKYIQFTCLTQKWLQDDSPQLSQLLTEQPAILAVWHSRILILPYFAPKTKNLTAIVSPHRDGALVTSLLKQWNVKAIRGSSNKKALPAAKNMLSALHNKNTVIITPDGPQGPRMRVKGSIINIAKKAAVPIIPIAFASSNKKIFNSWDQFMLTLPFGKSVFLSGKPIWITTSDKKRNEQKLEKALNTLTKKADIMVTSTHV